MKHYVLLYTDNRQCRTSRSGSLRQCRAVVRQLQGRVTDWAIYKASHKGRAFHNSTDSLFLVEHDDGYWHNTRFGHLAPHPAILQDRWVFWELLMDEHGFYIRTAGSVQPRDVRSFSRAYHAAARENGYGRFVRDQTLVGGHFAGSDGACLLAYPESITPDYPVR